MLCHSANGLLFVLLLILMIPSGPLHYDRYTVLRWIRSHAQFHMPGDNLIDGQRKINSRYREKNASLLEIQKH